VAIEVAVVDSVSAELLARWTSQSSARNGAPLCIRPLRPDDREREIEFINSLSERTRFYRLMTPLKFLPPHLLDRLMDIDYDRRMAFIAASAQDGCERFVGISRYGETDRPDTVELGITVSDLWQRQGIARLLIAELLRFARWRGIQRVEGIVIHDNLPMIELAKSLGFHVAHDYTQHVVVISQELGT
jgi:RimJ/RimL family protein N-acetyltransferase